MLISDILFDGHKRANIRLLAQRNIRTQIVGTYLGLGHYIILPLALILVYSFVFTTIFVTRWPTADTGTGSFALRMFVAMIPFQFFAEVTNRSPSLVLENSSYVKKVLFPLETLVPITAVTALFSSAVTFAAFILIYVLSYGLPGPTALWVFALWPPVVFITLGIGWLLATLGVFLRDLRQLAGVLTSIMMFLTPIFFPLSAIPAPYQIFILANPLSWPIEAMRQAWFDGASPSLVVLALYYIGSLAVAQLGYFIFMRAKRAFADVI